jgi:hypothetical protein
VTLTVRDMTADAQGAASQLQSNPEHNSAPSRAASTAGQPRKLMHRLTRRQHSQARDSNPFEHIRELLSMYKLSRDSAVGCDHEPSKTPATDLTVRSLPMNECIAWHLGSQLFIVQLQSRR